MRSGLVRSGFGVAASRYRRQVLSRPGACATILRSEGMTRTVPYRVAGGLDDLHRVARDHEAGAGLGDGLQVLQHEPVHRPRAAGGKLPLHRTVQLPHAGGAVDEIRAVGLGMDVGAVIGRIGGELPDDLLEQVFDRDHPSISPNSSTMNPSRSWACWKLRNCTLNGVPAGTK